MAKVRKLSNVTPCKLKQTHLDDIFRNMKKGTPLNLTTRKRKLDQTGISYQSPIVIEIDDNEDEFIENTPPTEPRNIPFPFSDDEEDVKPPLEMMAVNKPSSISVRPGKKIQILNDTLICPSTSSNVIPNSDAIPKSVPQLGPTQEKTEIVQKDAKLNLRSMNLFKDILTDVTNSLQSRNLLLHHIKILEYFLSMDHRYQYFCFKLYTHKLKWYSIIPFCHSIKLALENQQILEMYQYLTDKQFILTNFEEESTINQLHILGRAQISNIYNQFKLPRGTKNKTAMINILIKNCKSQTTLTSSKSFEDKLKEGIKIQMGYTVKLKSEVFEAFQKAFLLGTFANGDFCDFKNYSLQMLKNRVVFPQFELQDFIIFATNEEFELYSEARIIENELENTDKKLHNKLLTIGEMAFKNLKTCFENRNSYDTDFFTVAPFLKTFTAEYVYRRILTAIIRVLYARYANIVKTWLDYLLNKFPTCSVIGEWYKILCWLNMRYLDPVDYVLSAKMLIKLFDEKRDCLSDVQIYELAYRAEMIKSSKRHKIPQLYFDELTRAVPPPINSDQFPSYNIDACTKRKDVTGSLKRVYKLKDKNGDDIFTTVEDLAIRKYISERNYTHGIHCEGSIIKALFTLLFWDIIYDEDVPYTFILRVQYVPLDMFSKYFYMNRKEKIDGRLKDLELNWTSKTLLQIAKENYMKYSNLSGLCEIDHIIDNMDLLKDLLKCVGGSLLAKIFERLVKNFKCYQSGMPDLLIWNTKTKECIFVEVKGEGDKLSIKQKLWIEYLLKNKAKVEVCNVHSIGSKRKTVKKQTEKESSSSSDEN